jgi:DNA-binding transcriptional MocR family regulator
MHDAILWAIVHGMPGGPLQGNGPWRDVTFLCPVPGYDRHFGILEGLGIKMVPVPLTGAGPDMDMVERLVADPEIKGMWCVPKYSNPTGETYSAATVERLAKMRTAPDFRIFWDNAYGVHHLTEVQPKLANLLEACARAGNPDRAFVFASTSKITFGGGGLGMLATSKGNLDWYLKHMTRRTIGPDKLNQLRHVRFFREPAGIARHMEAQRQLLMPKFAAVYERFEALLGGTGVATWNRPDGGYFINLDVLDGCATRVVALAKELGIAMVPAGNTFPYRKDPRDRNIRIAPTHPPVEQVRTAAEGVALCVLLAASEKLA